MNWPQALGVDSVAHSEHRTERRGGELRTAQCLPCWNVSVLAADCPVFADETHPRYGEVHGDP